MKIAVIGAGYVGLGNAMLLAQNHNVLLIDKDIKKVNSINAGISPIEDKEVTKFIKIYKHNISATQQLNNKINGYRYCIIATPTNFIEDRRMFDTSGIDAILKDLNNIDYKHNIIIRSTLPIGYSKLAQQKFKNLKISFFPEFLREGFALHDNLNPSRVIAGGNQKVTKKFAKLLVKNAKKDDVPILLTSTTEAETIKLFSNAYLAMRIAFFNELDSFAMINKLSSENIIKGLSLDYRIGNYYNNPSFGYGGYCLPKDIKQLSSSFNNNSHKLIKAIIASNKDRKKMIAKGIIESDVKVIGIYRLSMKSESDNFREAAIIDIIKMIKKSQKKIIIYEPNLNESFLGCEVKNDLKKFISDSDIVLANRLTNEIKKYYKKIISRDIFNES